MATPLACSSEDEGATAAARAKLAQGCVLNSDCETPLLCTFQRCHQPCAGTRDCPTGQRCVVGDAPLHVCQLPDDIECGQGRVCPGPQICGIDARCRDECATSRDCVPGQECVSGACAEPTELTNGALVSRVMAPGQSTPCSFSSDCPSGQRCRAGLCGPPCQLNSDCSPLETCDAGTCTAIVSGPTTCPPETGQACTCPDGGVGVNDCVFGADGAGVSCRCSTGAGGAGGESGAAGAGGGGEAGGGGSSGGSAGSANQGGNAGDGGAAGATGGAGQGGAGAMAGGGGQSGGGAGGNAQGGGGQSGSSGSAGASGSGVAGESGASSGGQAGAGGQSACQGSASDDPLLLVSSLGDPTSPERTLLAALPCTKAGQSCGFWVIGTTAPAEDTNDTSVFVAHFSKDLVLLTEQTLEQRYVRGWATNTEGELAVLAVQTIDGSERLSGATTSDPKKPMVAAVGGDAQPSIVRFDAGAASLAPIAIPANLLTNAAATPKEQPISDFELGGIVYEGAQLWVTLSHTIHLGKFPETFASNTDAYLRRTAAVRFATTGAVSKVVPLLPDFTIVADYEELYKPAPRFVPRALTLWSPSGSPRLLHASQYLGSPLLLDGGGTLPGKPFGAYGSAIGSVTLAASPTKTLQSISGNEAFADDLVVRGDGKVFFVNEGSVAARGTPVTKRGVLDINPTTGAVAILRYESRQTLQAAVHPAAAATDGSVVVVQRGPNGIELAKLGSSLEQTWRHQLPDGPTATAIDVHGRVLVVGAAKPNACLGTKKLPVSATDDGGLYLATYAYLGVCPVRIPACPSTSRASAPAIFSPTSSAWCGGWARGAWARCSRSSTR